MAKFQQNHSLSSPLMRAAVSSQSGNLKKGVGRLDDIGRDCMGSDSLKLIVLIIIIIISDNICHMWRSSIYDRIPTFGGGL